jgi:hypothetical protein
MAKRELIYKDEARRAVLRNAPGVAWSIDNIKPVAVVDDETSLPKPETSDVWVARIKYWPGANEIITIVRIFYAWKDGAIQFVPWGGDDGDPIWATNCQLFELLEKIDLEKYK